MSAASRLAAFGVILGIALGAGALAGAVLGPEPDEESPAPHPSHGEAGGEAPGMLPGLAVSQQGYTFAPEQATLAASGGPFRFTITGPDGAPVHDYQVEHDKELHLIVASRDLSQFRHVHPERDAAGVWDVDLPALPPGPYRAFADFTAQGGPSLTLGVDLVVPGPYDPPARPAAGARSTIDGFMVELVADDPHPGEDVAVTVRVTAPEGAPAALEPYLGAHGHLVALREGDLAYLHVHPEESAGTAGEVGFVVELPSAGRYRLFFDFQVDGVVRTGDFTLDVSSDAERSGEHR